MTKHFFFFSPLSFYSSLILGICVVLAGLGRADLTQSDFKNSLPPKIKKTYFDETQKNKVWQNTESVRFQEKRHWKQQHLTQSTRTSVCWCGDRSVSGSFYPIVWRHLFSQCSELRWWAATAFWYNHLLCCCTLSVRIRGQTLTTNQIERPPDVPLGHAVAG